MLASFFGILFWFVTPDLSNKFHVIAAHSEERLGLPHRESGRYILDNMHPCYSVLSPKPMVMSHRRLCLGGAPAEFGIKITSVLACIRKG